MMKNRRNVWIIVFVLLVVLFGCWLFLSRQVKTTVEEEGVEILNDMTIGE